MLRAVTPLTLNGRRDTDTLVIVLHGCTWTPRRRRTQLRDVVEAIGQACDAPDIFLPQMPIEFWSLEDPDQVVSQLLFAIDELWNARAAAARPYSRVIMVGFSFGSVLLRQLYCKASGALDDATIGAPQRPWAACVSRMVLLAGLNRGWTTDSPVTRLESAINGVGTAIGHLLPRKPTIFAIRRGAPFLTRTRLQWLSLRKAKRTPHLTVQLLGTRDDIVSPSDNVDLATGDDFVYIEVPQSGHFDVVSMSRFADDDVHANRRARFQKALSDTRLELAPIAIEGGDLLELLPAEAGVRGELALNSEHREHPHQVVFVVHGIRDKGYWTRKVARVIVSQARKAGHGRVLAVAPTYGYFPLLPFLLPWTRRANIEWLLDHYVSVRAAYPDAAISFVGHSNGTYVLAGAVAACPAVRFHHVVFAGSVVRSGFRWERYVGRNRQVGKVLNFVATGDWVVAIFPRWFEVLRLQDLGGAGHDGFGDRLTEVKDIRYVPGDHSAALDERYWDDIARFLDTGDAPESREAVAGRSPFVAAAGHLAGVLWLVLAAAALLPTYALLARLGFPTWSGLGRLNESGTLAAPVQPWVWAIVLMVWIRFLRTVLTRL